MKQEMKIEFDKPTVERDHPIVREGGSGTQKIWRFVNGYGASVVQFKLTNYGFGSYSNNEQEWELAVIKFRNKKDIDNFEIRYDTGIADDVMGYLSKEEIVNILNKILKLK